MCMQGVPLPQPSAFLRRRSPSRFLHIGLPCWPTPQLRQQQRPPQLQQRCRLLRDIPMQQLLSPCYAERRSAISPTAPTLQRKAALGRNLPLLSSPGLAAAPAAPHLHQRRLRLRLSCRRGSGLCLWALWPAAALRLSSLPTLQQLQLPLSPATGRCRCHHSSSQSRTAAASWSRRQRGRRCRR